MEKLKLGTINEVKCLLNRIFMKGTLKTTKVYTTNFTSKKTKTDK